MADHQTIIFKETFNFIRQNFIQIASFLVLGANVWIASQLSPVVARIQTLEVQAATFEADYKNIGGKVLTMEQSLENIDNRTVRIESLLDKLFVR